MSVKPISPLRQRMIDDMTAPLWREGSEGLRPAREELRGLPRPVAGHGHERGPSPPSAHMAKQQIGAPTINSAIAALRFFFTATLERPDLVRPLRIGS